MMETTDQVRERLVKEAEDRVANRLSNATSVGAGDSAMQDHRFALKRINAMSDADLAKKAIEVSAHQI